MNSEEDQENLIYLDYNATTPIDPSVADVILPYIFQQFGNPSNSYTLGKNAKNAIIQSRELVADFIGCNETEIIFTSTATESINMALRGAAISCRRKDKTQNHVITAKTEHIAVLETCRYLETLDFNVTYLDVNEYGSISSDDLLNSITDKTCLISLMLANNETGTILDISNLCKLSKIKKNDIIFHTDTSAACGKINVDIKYLNIDLLTLASHKIYAPKNCGVLYIKNGIEIDKLIYGASQENGKRAGTENVIAIVGLGTACSLAKTYLSKTYKHLKKLRDLLFEKIIINYTGKFGPPGDFIRVNGEPENRLPNTLSISFKNCSSSSLMSFMPRIACSAGSACHGNNPSHVLSAMKVPKEYITGTLRLTLGTMTSEDEIELAAKYIVDAIELELKRINNK